MNNPTFVNKPTIEDIKQTLHKVDLINRPFIAFIHPDDAEAIKNLSSKIEKVVIQPTPCVEKGKCVCVKREYLELLESEEQNAEGEN